MAELRCPMCGKQNSDDLDICQFCQARLKPLIASSPSDSPSSDLPAGNESSFDNGTSFNEKPTSSSDLPDWLDFDADAEFDGIDDDSSSSAAPFDGGDDWLSRLDGTTESEDASPLQPEADPDAEQTRATPPLEEPQETTDDEIPVWLTVNEESEAANDLPDWLVDGGSENEDTDPIPTSESNLPDWLTASNDQPAAGSQDGDDEITRPALKPDGSDIDHPAASDNESEFKTGYVGQETIPIQNYETDADLPDWLSSEDDGEAESILPASEADLPDWLTDLGGKETAVPEETPLSQESVPGFSAADDVDELPDWFISEDDDETESIIPTSEADLSDWPTDLGGEETAEPEEAPLSRASVPDLSSDDDADELPDWLSDEDDGDTESILPASEADLPDWLSDLSGEETAEPKVATPAQEAVPAFSADDDAGELPDWLSDEDDGDTESSILAAESGLPEWLSDLDDEETIEPEEAPPAQASDPAFISDDAKGVTDWLSEGSAEKVDSVIPASDADLPDWLPELGDEETAEPEVATPAQEAVPAFSADDDAGELPDWLSDEEDTESGILAAESDLPEWLSNLDDEETIEPEEAPPAQASVPAFISDDAKSVTDWLSDGGAEEVESDIPAAVGDLPDWLSHLDDEETIEPGAAAALALASVPAFSSDDEEDIPDWLSEISGQDVPPDPIAEMDGIEDVRPEDGLPTFPDTEEIPEWLSELDGWEETPPEESLPETEPDIQPVNVDESRAVPSWLQEFEGEVTDDGALADPALYDEEEAAPAEAISVDQEDEFEDELSEFDQLPAWLSDSPQPDEDQTEEIAGPTDDIAPAELPGWLAAMRPVESAISGAAGVEQRGPMENSGPLAGLHSVLAAEPAITQLKKPPVYSNKLEVTKAQQTHATILRNLLEAEGKPQDLPSPPLISSQRVFRLILGIILIIIAFIAVLVSGDMVAMPDPDVIPAGVEQTYQIVAALSSEDTALVAFDYEPGLVGEMDATSAAIVNNVMEKGTKLVLVSSSPTGPALAERFINEIQGSHQYNSGTQYINLGYIPGGVSGLAAFAQNPEWVAPTTLDGAQAWETEPLKNIQSLSDFSVAILITDNPNTTRAWVEQVNPHLEPAPLVAVISAQVEPMARPYFGHTSGGQIDGLVSGLTGGAAYEVMSGSNLAREQWDAFNIILIVAMSAILIGGIINIGSTIIARQKENEGESA